MFFPGWLSKLVVSLFVFLWVLPGAAQGGENPGLSELVPRIKPSVLAVGTYQRTRSPPFLFRGTGFVVGDGLWVATNAHVLPENVNSAQGESIAVVQADGSNAKVRIASVVDSDPRHDVALLRFQGEPLPPLVLGGVPGAREGQAIAFTGFPLGVVLGLNPVTHRGIISAITPISIPRSNARELSALAIRQLEGRFDIFQLDATAYPGNSGSPVFDAASGDVLGIVNMVFVKGSKESALSQPSGITYAIPVSYLKAMLDQHGGAGR